jgi:hypothetical protein
MFGNSHQLVCVSVIDDDLSWRSNPTHVAMDYGSTKFTTDIHATTNENYSLSN